MTTNVLTIEGRRYAVVPWVQWQALVVARRARAPALPPADGRGLRPAQTTGRVLIARGLIQRRVALGLKQKDLAAAAGVTVETVSRLESGKHRPQRETLLRIDTALRKLEKRTRKRRG